MASGIGVVGELKFGAVPVVVVDNLAPFPIRDAQQLGEEIRVVVGGFGSQQSCGKARQRVPFFAQVHAADCALDQGEAHPLVDILHMECAVLEKDDLRSARRAVIDESEKSPTRTQQGRREAPSRPGV